MSAKITREQLLERYSDYDIPQVQLTVDCLPDESLIFTKQSITPLKKSEWDFSASFFISDRSHKHKNKQRVWRIEKEKEKGTEKEKEKDIPEGMEINTQTKEEDANKIDKSGEETISHTGNASKISKENFDMSINMFDEYLKLSSQVPFPFGIPIAYPGIIPVIPRKITQEEIKIDNIFHFNTKFDYPTYLPAMYLFSPFLHSISGPFPTQAIKDMYINGTLDSSAEIRMIDIFIFKDIKPFEFVGISIINTDNWADLIFDSPLLKHTELFSKSKKLFDKGNVVTKINIDDVIELRHQKSAQDQYPSYDFEKKTKDSVEGSWDQCKKKNEKKKNEKKKKKIRPADHQHYMAMTSQVNQIK